MAQVSIVRVTNGNEKGLAIFDEIARRLEEVQRRAFSLFERRGRTVGSALGDWLAAEREVMGWPAAELAEKAGAYELQVTLPGFEAKDVEVTATPREIVVHASVHEKKTGKEKTVVWTEFESDDVCRRFEVPKMIKVDAVSASLDNGILTITAPAAAERKAKKAAASA